MVANNNVHTDGPFTVRVPYQEIGFADAEYQLTDLLTGQVVAAGNYVTMYDFTADVARDKAGIYLLTKVSDIPEDQRHTLLTYDQLKAHVVPVTPASRRKPLRDTAGTAFIRLTPSSQA